MPVNTANLVLGPATLYSGLFGAAEPLDSQVNNTPAASAWSDVGATTGGVKLVINQTYTALNADQVVDTVGRRLTGRDIQVQTTLAEVTLQNLAVALNGGTVVTGSGATPSTYDPAAAISATQPLYNALIMDGWGPSQFRRRVFVRKVLSMASTELEYAEANQAGYAVTFGAHYVSATVIPFHIVDANQ